MSLARSSFPSLERRRETETRSLTSPLLAFSPPFSSAITEYRISKRVEEQFQAFMSGFNELIPQELINVFDERELEVRFLFPPRLFPSRATLKLTSILSFF